MPKQRLFTVASEDYHEGTMGICLSCGETAFGVEPDARQYTCESCDRMTVYGMEEALIMGRIDVQDEDY